MAVVVDASALVAILMAEPEGAAIAERLAGQALVGAPMLPYEVANEGRRMAPVMMGDAWLASRAHLRIAS